MVTSIFTMGKMRRGFRRQLIRMLAALLLTSPISPLIAKSEANTWVVDVFSPTDISTPALVDPNYDLDRLRVGLGTDDLDRLYFWMYFKRPVTSSMFVSSSNSGRAPWASIIMWRNNPSSLGGNGDDFRVQVNQSTAYPQTNSWITASAEGNTISGGTRSSLSSCSPRTWSDIANGANWIGFSISRSCAKIPDVFYVTAYAEGNTTNSTSGSDWDYVPDSTALMIDLNKRTATSSTSPAATPSPTPIVKRSQNFYMDYPSGRSFVPIVERSASINTRSDGGFRNVRSLTPFTCTVNEYGQQSNALPINVSLISEGTCSLEGYAPSTTTYLESSKYSLSFQIERVLQEVDVYIPDKPRIGSTITLEVTSSGESSPLLSVATPKICTAIGRADSYRLKLIKIGTCRFELFDAGSRDYEPYEDTWEFDVINSGRSGNTVPNPSPTKKTISGSASTSNKPNSSPSKKPSTSTKIGGTADTKKP